MWDLSSPTRDQAQSPALQVQSLNYWIPGNSPHTALLIFLFVLRSQESVCLHACVLSHLSHVLFFVTPWTVACQARLSMRFSRQEYWSGLSCSPPGDLPNAGIEPVSF